jgi:hypothetical protein
MAVRREDRPGEHLLSSSSQNLSTGLSRLEMQDR